MKSSEHIDHLIQDWLDGELDASAARDVEQHVQECAACRREMESLQALVADVQRLPRTQPPPRDLWPEIEARLSDGEDGRRPMPRRRSRLWLGGAVVTAALVAAAIIWMLMQGGRAGWDVETLTGSPLVANRPVDASGVLRPGQWLETDSASRARVLVGAIGDVAVDPNTRIQLQQSRLDEHRIALAEGRIEARIWAPPRLFFVETPSATAIDLGCTYTLDVDSTGKSLLHVTAGYVELEKDGRASVVPAGAMCYASPMSGPGTVFAEDASTALRNALQRYDFEGSGREDLDIILAEARAGDAITLWQLVERSEGERRTEVYDRLVELVRSPAGATREGVLAGDEEMALMWRMHLGLEALSWWGYLREKLSIQGE